MNGSSRGASQVMATGQKPADGSSEAGSSKGTSDMAGFFCGFCSDSGEYPDSSDMEGHRMIICSCRCKSSGTILVHDYRTCQSEDCQECQELVNHGLVEACDECGTPGSSSSDGFVLLNSGKLLCLSCADGNTCGTPGCSNHVVEEDKQHGEDSCLLCHSEIHVDSPS